MTVEVHRLRLTPCHQVLRAAGVLRHQVLRAVAVHITVEVHRLRPTPLRQVRRVVHHQVLRAVVVRHHRVVAADLHQAVLRDDNG